MKKNDVRAIRYNERYLQGLCIYCGKCPFVENKKGCQSCLKRNYKRSKKYTANNRERINLSRRKLRKDVVEKYGGRCVCCGENNWEFLAIDHINNDGGSERREKYGTTKGSNIQWFPELKKLPVRSDLQVLCFNCNMAKSIFGICPHSSSYNNMDFSVLKIDRRKKNE